MKIRSKYEHCLTNDLQWKLDQNTNIVLKVYTFENVVCEMSSILSRPDCITWRSGDLPLCPHISWLGCRDCLVGMYFSHDTSPKAELLHNTLLNMERLRLRQNGWQFVNDIFEYILLNENCSFWFKFHWSLFLRDRLIISHHWCRQWFGAKPAPSHYLKHGWPRPV